MKVKLALAQYEMTRTLLNGKQSNHD